MIVFFLLKKLPYLPKIENRKSVLKNNNFNLFLISSQLKRIKKRKLEIIFF